MFVGLLEISVAFCAAFNVVSVEAVIFIFGGNMLVLTIIFYNTSDDSAHGMKEDLNGFLYIVQSENGHIREVGIIIEDSTLLNQHLDISRTFSLCFTLLGRFIRDTLNALPEKDCVFFLTFTYAALGGLPDEHIRTNVSCW